MLRQEMCRNFRIKRRTSFKLDHSPAMAHLTFISW